ncbi:MAG TPA: hypothetical protein VMY39_05420 [Planctomycetota bacterium]|nr:hypothetical protein [Planctomycetota bacterium]
MAVLKAITEGDDYFFTPSEVTKRMMDYAQIKGSPTYCVHSDTGAEPPKIYSGHQFDEKFAVSVKGWIRTMAGESTTIIERCIRDIRTAIDADTVSTAAGSLGALGALPQVDTVETDSGWLAIEGFGYFDQRFIFRIRGDWRNL